MLAACTWWLTWVIWLPLFSGRVRSVQLCFGSHQIIGHTPLCFIVEHVSPLAATPVRSSHVEAGLRILPAGMQTRDTLVHICWQISLGLRPFRMLGNYFGSSGVEYLTFNLLFKQLMQVLRFLQWYSRGLWSCWMSRSVSGSQHFKKPIAVVFHGSLSMEIKAVHCLETPGTTDGILKYKIKHFQLYFYPPFGMCVRHGMTTKDRNWQQTAEKNVWV